MEDLEGSDPRDVTDEPRHRSPEAEDAWVMRLLDSILQDLDLAPADEEVEPAPPTEPAIDRPPEARPIPAPVAPPRVATRTSIPVPPTKMPPTAPSRGAPSPYLEERLSAALRAIAELREEVQEIALRSQVARDTIEAVELELGRGARELAFVRSQVAAAPIAPAILPRSAARPKPTTAPMAVPGRSASRGPSAPRRFEQFTVERYNRTMSQVKGRRRRMAGWMVVIAGLLSVALVSVDLLFPNPQPAWWLGILPIVWMIPVPFFVLSFRGTQRVLRRNHFDLPGDA